MADQSVRGPKPAASHGKQPARHGGGERQPSTLGERSWKKVVQAKPREPSRTADATASRPQEVLATASPHGHSFARVEVGEGAAPGIGAARPGNVRSSAGGGSAPRSRQDRSVVQRVTYKQTKYEPDVEEEQSSFLEEAEKDLRAAKAWAEGRSKRIVATLGLTDEDIENVEALVLAEQAKWQEFDKANHSDIGKLAEPLKTIEEVATELTRLLPNLVQNSGLVRNIQAQVDLLKGAAQLIPNEKYRLREYPTLGVVAKSVESYMAKKPWEAAVEKLRLESELEQERRKIPELDKVTKVEEEPAREELIDKLTKRLEKRYSKKLATPSKILDLLPTALEEIQGLAKVPLRIPDSLRLSAEEQFVRGQKGYRYDKGGKTGLGKIYIGQIEDTEKIRGKGDKGRGVLWATPWAPGVNVGFVEGGISSGRVFKLKTDIPDNLAGFLEKGDIEGFKQAVEGKAQKEYWPFWHSKEHRFTVYTVELETLIAKGYRLRRAFKRTVKKGGVAQQLMATDKQMPALEEYYEGR